MPRRRRATRREIPPDAKYNSEMVARFINKVMKCGKKSTAEGIVYTALEMVGSQEGGGSLETLEQAIKHATPLLRVKPRRVGGATYQVPVEVNKGQGLSLAMRWLLSSARARSGRSMAEKLAAEIADAAQSQGAAVKKREDTHKMAEANRAFAHYRW